MTNFLPFALPQISEDEIDEVVDTLRSGWLTTGKKCARFESEFSRVLGVEHSLAVNSATAGLHLALDAVGLKSGQKVITTPYTFTATAEVIRYFNADPIFVDVNPKTSNISISALQETAERHQDAVAIVPVHMAGQACSMSEIMGVADRFDMRVVEDAAHALPTTSGGKLIGGLSDIAVFSFYVTKTIATGEGGMVTTNNPQFYERMKVMRLHGISKDVFNRYQSDKPSWYYEVVAPGYKYNMTDIAASIGLHQLKKVWEFQKRREAIALRYSAQFEDLPLTTPHIDEPSDVHSWHLYMLQLDLDSLTIDRDRFIELLMAQGIGASVHFIPLHIQPYWQKKYGFKPEDFPNAHSLYLREISLPIYPAMTDEDVARVISAVRNITLAHIKQ